MASMPDPRAAAMTEAQLDTAIEKIAAFLGLLSYHTWTAVHSPRGWPDRVYAVRAGQRATGLMFRELKRQGKNPTAAQQMWLDAITAAGLDADVWRPEDLLSGRVTRELASLAGLPVRQESA